MRLIAPLLAIGLLCGALALRPYDSTLERRGVAEGLRASLSARLPSRLGSKVAVKPDNENHLNGIEMPVLNDAQKSKYARLETDEERHGHLAQVAAEKQELALWQAQKAASPAQSASLLRQAEKYEELEGLHAERMHQLRLDPNFDPLSPKKPSKSGRLSSRS